METILSIITILLYFVVGLVFALIQKQYGAYVIYKDKDLTIPIFTILWPIAFGIVLISAIWYVVKDIGNKEE